MNLHNNGVCLGFLLLLLSAGRWRRRRRLVVSPRLFFVSARLFVAAELFSVATKAEDVVSPGIALFAFDTGV